MHKIKDFFRRFIEDLLILIGLLIIIVTTLKLNIFIGLYTLGFIITLIGIYKAYNPPK